MKKIFRGFFLAVLICVLAVGSLAGCKLSGDGEFDEKLLDEIDLTADESFSGELNIRTTSEESEVVIMNALIKAFNEKYPYIRVNYTQELLDNYYSSLSNDAGTAETLGDYSLMPDVFWLAQDRLDSLYSLDSLLFPLGRIEARDETFSSDILVDEALSVSTVNDMLYMMPRDYNQVVMYFNQDIFDAAGVDYPTAQMSREAFVGMLADLRAGLDASDAVNGYGVPYKDAVKNLIDVNSQWDSWVWPLVKSFGGEVVNEDGSSALNSENTFNAVSFWKSLRTANYVGTITTTNSGVNFRMQQSAIYFHARAVLSDIIKSTQQIKGVQNLGVTAIPQFGSEYAIGGGSSGYGMYLKAQNKTAAWLFLKFVVSEAGQNAFCATGNGVPSVRSLLNDEAASWRAYESEAFGTAFDNDAFVYGLGTENAPFASTRDFFRYIPVAAQTDVLTCLRSCFTIIDAEDNSDATIRQQISNQSELINYYVNQAKK